MSGNGLYGYSRLLLYSLMRRKGLLLLTGKGHLFFRGRLPASTMWAASPWHEYAEGQNEGKRHYLPPSVELFTPGAEGAQPFPGREILFGG